MPTTFLDGLANIRRMANARTDIGAGNCKLRTREAFGVPSNGTGSASASWAAAPDKHHSSNPADAPPLSFGWMTGGGQGFGHVVVIDEDGHLWTPGGPDNDDAWYETTAARLLSRWPNLRWVGWTRSIDGQYPALPPPPPPSKAEQAAATERSLTRRIARLMRKIRRTPAGPLRRRLRARVRLLRSRR